ncbi:hypothetical protein TYRP_018084 [Tyrophagus putrescentiae]|nr:hypothetical protein TYRP_018084 [Tyrophagus putrescentiae]
MSGKRKDPCVKFSCLLESCTRKHNYNAEHCAKELNSLLACCRQFGPKMAPSCEGFHELDEQYETLEKERKKES